MQAVEKVSVVVTPEVKRMLAHRAEMNNRSISKEIMFLIETALALKSENTRDMIHFMHKIGGNGKLDL